jgi:phospholipid transport system substrate-binding protein
MKPNPSESRRRALLGAMALLVGLGLPGHAAAAEVDPAAAPIRAFYDALLVVMKQADQLGVRGRYDKLAPVIRSTFDLPAMTRIAVGPEWTAIPPDQQAALLDNFARMTIATYANRFDGWSGQTSRLTRKSCPQQRSHRAHQAGPPEGRAGHAHYLMRGTGDNWKVVDIYLSGNHQRAGDAAFEFSAILKAGGPAALIESLASRPTS